VKFLGLASPVIGMAAAQRLAETARTLEAAASMRDVVQQAVTAEAGVPA